MHLRSLRLRGFKSFPDQLELKLEPGVAVVVGPNGSGKSNVADAIVWASGSLTPSELRAEKPDDVLFNGAEGRSPADSCEVELVFDNADGGFGDELDFSEVSIARRLHRGGEGQYLVNRAQVRRTDLVELLADVGLGGSMHSIVSQGKVEAVLASKPEERRALVEEAAGLGKFKRRKHRAELKLARVATQVERARDVEAEVRKRLRPLALQATAAERAAKLGVEVARLRARIAELDLASADARREAAEERKTAAALARRAAHERLESLLAQRQEAEEELADAAGRREAAVKALYRLQGAAERVAVRQEGAAALLARLRSDLDGAERAAAEVTDERVRALEAAATAATARARTAAAEAGAAAERARSAQERLAALERGAAARAEERLEALRTERQALEAELADVAGGREGATKALYRLGSTRERIALRAESVAALRERLHHELAEAESAAKRPGPTPAELEAAANAARAEARAAANERDDVTARLALARERIAALEQSLAEREGLPPAARAFAEEGTALALSLIEVAPGRERAVAAALGWRASALVADDAAAAFALLRRACDRGLGSVTVLVGSPAARVDALPVVAADELLASTVPAVTAEGFGYDPDRGELWFAGETAEAVLLELRTRLCELQEDANALDAERQHAEVAAAAAASRAAEAEAAYAAVAHLRAARALDPRVLRRAAAIADRLDEALLGSAAVAQRVEEPLRMRADAGAERASALGGELARVGALEHEARREATAANERAAAAELVRARLGGEGQIRLLQVDEAERAAVEAEARHLTDEAERLAALATEAAEAARDAGAEVAETGAKRAATLDADLVRRVLAGAERLDETLVAAAAAAARFEAPLRARVDAGASRTAELGARLRELGAAEVELRRTTEEAAQRATQVEIELTRIDAESADARRRLEEAAAEPAEGNDRDELAARAERLEARRIQLGQVNPLAQEEYEAEKERLAELETQRADLEASLKELEDLRNELADTVERRFSETFATVASHFEEVATTLFPGGEGRLRLVEPEDEEGELGVEVELRPAGKKITRLGMLSGGEKALGAISFLFALFLAKPCPFYLLDEVEAALDDANIGRFVELLRRYADRAQFIVITHQKRTMEAADVLYGVTMAGDGVSQVVSRRLPREDAAAIAS
ncbi:MAG TPA: AAA family ATPase, partial [Gaiellaceae bacterium]|nr:AAA family ATPase [Gaiellaceae bacterium]